MFKKYKEIITHGNISAIGVTFIILVFFQMSLLSILILKNLGLTETNTETIMNLVRLQTNLVQFGLIYLAICMTFNPIHNLIVYIKKRKTKKTRRKPKKGIKFKKYRR